jgi:hypothetical protein
MPAAFVATGFADASTNATYFLGAAAAQAQQLCCGITNGRAFHIQLYAVRHHFDILFF